MYLDDLRRVHALLSDLSSADDRSYFTLAKRHTPMLVDNARDAGYITVSALNICRLTPAGQQHLAHLSELLQTFEQQSQQYAYQQSNDRRGRIHSWLQFFGTLFLGWLLGGITPQAFWKFVSDFLIGLLH